MFFFFFIFFFCCHSSREVDDHCVKWNKTFNFQVKMSANASTGLLDTCTLRLSIRKVCWIFHSFFIIFFFTITIWLWICYCFPVVFFYKCSILITLTTETNVIIQNGVTMVTWINNDYRLRNENNNQCRYKKAMCYYQVFLYSLVLDL